MTINKEGTSTILASFFFTAAIAFLLFWLSGILYDASKIELTWIRNLLMFNPVTLMVNGFRNALVYNKWFWEEPIELRNFVILYVVMSLLAVWAYRKLYKEIPDIL